MYQDFNDKIIAKIEAFLEQFPAKLEPRHVFSEQVDHHNQYNHYKSYEEMRQSVKIVKQAMKQIPDGPYFNPKAKHSLMIRMRVIQD